jgi:hypothetical protein
VEEATWEREDALKIEFPHLFRSQLNLEDEIHFKWGRFVVPMFLSYLNCITNHLLKNLLNLFRRLSSQSLPPDFPPSRHHAVLFFRGAAHPFSFSTGPTVPSHHHRVVVGRVRLPGRDRWCHTRVLSFLFSYFVQIHFISLF